MKRPFMLLSLLTLMTSSTFASEIKVAKNWDEYYSIVIEATKKVMNQNDYSKFSATADYSFSEGKYTVTEEGRCTYEFTSDTHVLHGNGKTILMRVRRDFNIISGDQCDSSELQRNISIETFDTPTLQQVKDDRIKFQKDLYDLRKANCPDLTFNIEFKITDDGILIEKSDLDGIAESIHSTTALNPDFMTRESFGNPPVYDFTPTQLDLSKVDLSSKINYYVENNTTYAGVTTNRENGYKLIETEGITVKEVFKQLGISL